MSGKREKTIKGYRKKDLLLIVSIVVFWLAVSIAFNCIDSVGYCPIAP